MAKLMRDMRIVIPQGASRLLEKAASELAFYVERVVGRRPAISREDSGSAGVPVWLGPCAVNRGLLEESAIANVRPQNDGYVIRCRRQDVQIAGANDRSVLFGVYRFARDVLGVGFWHYDDEIIPRNPQLSLDPMEIAARAESEIIQLSGGFEERYLLNLVKVGFNAISARFDRLVQGNADTRFADEYGLKLVSGGHCIEMFLPHERYFASHPEWYPLRDGKRAVTGHICFADPEAARALVANAVEMARAARSKYPRFDLLSIWPQDSGRVCQCEYCSSHEFTQMYVDLINRIAQAVRDSKIGLSIEYILYNCDNDYYRKRDLAALTMPRSRPPEMAADALFAYWGRAYGAPFEESRVAKDVEALGLLMELAEFSKRSGRKFRMFEYYPDHWMLSTVFPILWDSMGPDFRLFNRLGYSGLWSCDAAVDHPEDYPMLWIKGWANFALGALAWSSETDVDALAQRYIRQYYGAGAESAARIIEVFRRKVPPMSRHNLAHPFPGLAGLLPWDGTSDVTNFYFDPAGMDPEFWVEHETLIADVAKLAGELEAAAAQVPADRSDDARRLGILDKYRAWCVKKLRSVGLQLEAQKTLRAQDYAGAKKLLARAWALDGECGGLGLNDYAKWWKNLPAHNAGLEQKLREAGITVPAKGPKKNKASPYGQ